MAVFTWTCDYPVGYDLELEEIRVPLGAGVEKVVEKSVPVSRQDGTGSASSYNGANVFTVRLSRKARSVDADAIWDFIRTRLSDKAPFVWYDPAITAPPDPTGVDPDGKHTVILRSAKRVLTHLDRFSFELILAEDLS